MGKEKKNNLEEEYQKSLNDYFEADDAVKKMEQYKIIRKYFELVKKREELDKKETELYKKRLRLRYANCNHILVESHTDIIYDYEGRSYHYYGCIKCGLDEAVAERDYGCNREEITMLELMKEYGVYKINGIRTGICCDLYKAKELYADLKEKYPDATDEEMAEIFKKSKKAKKLMNEMN